MALVAGLLAAVAAPAGAAALEEWSRKAQQAPDQRWGTAAGRPHRVAGKRNTAAPKTLSAKYPPVSFPAAKPIKQSARVAKPAVRRQGFDPKHSRELPAGRDRFERVFANPDGTQTTMFSGGPVNTKDERGAWVPIDPSLVADPVDGEGWRTKRDDIEVEVSDRASASGLVELALDDERSLAFGLAGARAVAGRAGSGDEVRFANVAPKTDLTFQGTPGGLKEVILLRDASAPREFTFPLELRGLSAELASDGGVELKDGEGAVRAVIPPGFMEDSASGASGAARSTAVRYRLVDSGDGVDLRVTVDDAWLDDPDRVYPVKVDPTVLAAETSQGLRVSDNGSASGSSELTVGRKNGVRYASYLGFPGVSQTLRYHTIYGAQLQVVAYDGPSCKPRAMTVHPVTQSWSSQTNTSYPGPSVGKAIASQSFAYGYIGVGQSASACPANAAIYNLGTAGRDLVQGWVDGSKPNYGLSLRASETDSLAWKSLAGTSTENPPKLYITHSPYDASYSIPKPVPNPPVLKSAAGKIKVNVRNRGAESWTPSTYKLVYRVYDSKGKRIGTKFDAAVLPGSVARGALVSLEATIQPLPAGQYVIDFSMEHIGKAVFTDQQVPPARLIVQVVDVPPVLQDLYPPNGYQAPTLQPQLWARASDLDATPDSSLTYKFDLCESDDDAEPINCTSTSYSANQAWTPPVDRLVWGKTYLWRASVRDGNSTVTSPYVTLLAAVPQPPITSTIAGAPYGTQDKEYDPQVGNFSTVALDAPVVTGGPELRVVRSYNSLDPRADGSFGAGWTTRYDMRVVADSDGSGNVVVTYADGQQARFGRNPDGSYVSPMGRTAKLTYNAASTEFTLTDGTAYRYVFSHSGKLIRIYGPWAKPQVIEYGTNGKIQTVRNESSGRKLTFTWSGNHVSRVATDAVGDEPAPTWTYSYDGDLLTQACAPDGSCTRYEYAAGSHYRSSVLDSRPDSYYRLDEEDGDAAGSEIAVNLGKDAGTYTNVTIGQPGSLAGTDDGAASFSGVSSRVTLPTGTLKKARDGAVEMWFKTSTGGVAQPLIGYQNLSLGKVSTSGVPLLYVGADGKLRGQFRTGASIAPITSPATVNDGEWHHVILSASGATQTMFLDGVPVGSRTGTISHLDLSHNQIGSAYVPSTSWPSYGSTPRRYFVGSIDEVAIYEHPVGPEAAAAHFRLGTVAAQQMSEVALPSGKVASSVVYDTALDRVKEYTDSNGGTWKIGAPAMSGTEKDLRRRVVVLDPRDRPYLYEYDGKAGRLVRTGTPNGTTTGSLGTEEDELAGLALRTFEYDDKGFMTGVINELGARTTMTYDDRGNVTSKTTCRAQDDCQTSYSTYPSDLAESDPRSALPTETRDPRSASATDTTYRTSYAYTTRGDLTRQTTPDGRSVWHTYSNGTEAAFDAPGTIPSGLVLETRDHRNQVTRYAYYQTGDVAQITEPTGVVTTYTYDALGRRSSMTEMSDAFPDGVTTTYGYDALSRLKTETGPVVKNEVTGEQHQLRSTNEYDEDGSLIRQTVSDLKGDDPDRVTEFSYDEHNRLASTTDPEGNETSFGYDEFGNRTFTVDPNGNRIEYKYTARNQVAQASILDWDGDPAEAPELDDKRLVTDSYAYDDAGRLVRKTDSMGRTTRTEYYDDDLVKRVVLEDHRSSDGTVKDYVLEENTYDAAGNVLKQVAANGTSTVNNSYDAMGRVIRSAEDPLGINRITRYSYGAYGDLLEVTRAGGWSNIVWAEGVRQEITRYTYDTFGRKITESQASGTSQLTTSYEYDQRGHLTSVTDPRGNEPDADAADFTTAYRYDELGRRVAVTAPPVAVESGGQAAQVRRPTSLTGYNAFGEVVATKDPLGRVARTEYDKSGRAVAATGAPYTAPGASEAVVPRSTIAYDGVGNVVRTVDARGARTEFTYDRLSRLKTRNEPAGSNDERAVWRYEHTRSGEVLSVTSPTGARVESTYDDMDRPLTQTSVERYPSEDNFTTRFKYDDAGNLIETVSPSGAVTKQQYDSIGQLIKITDPNGVPTHYGYDPFGRQVRTSDGKGRTTRLNFNMFGQLTFEAELTPYTYSIIRRQDYTYDAASNLVTATSHEGHERTFRYDALDRVVEQTEPVTESKSITTSWGYDAAGNRTRYTDGRGNSTIYTTNSLGLPESVIEPATEAHPDRADRTWSAAYDAGGAAVRLTAPGGVTRARTYDTAGRLVGELGDGAESATTAKSLGYDLAGRLVKASGPGGDIAFSYDDRGNLRSATGPSGDSQFTYNADSQLVGRLDAAGTAEFGYTKGRLTTIKDAITGTTQTLGYDISGMVTSVDYGSDRRRTYGYDDLGRLTSDVLKNSAGTVVASVAYGYDLDDHVTSKTSTGTAGASENAYRYDRAGRLTSWTADGATTAYAWDDSGNRISAEGLPAIFDERNRVLDDGTSTYTYTPRGTLAEKKTEGEGGAKTEKFSFDAFDRLIAQGSRQYSYDAFDRTTSVNGQEFSYAGASDEPVSDGVQTFARGPLDELLAIQQGQGERLVLSDLHGDVIGGFDPADSTLAGLSDSRTYDPFGQVIASEGTDFAVGFQGDWTDPETGSVDMGARWYDPSSGRFTSRDSVDYVSGASVLANRYTYGAADPVTQTDPDGHWPSCGWCKKAANAVKNAVSSAANWAWDNIAKPAWGYAQAVGRAAWNLGKAVVRTVSKAASWVASKARAAINTVVDLGRKAYNGIKGGASAAGNWAKERARQAAAAAHAAAVRVQQVAKKAAAYAAKHNPLPAIKAAFKPIMAGVKKVVSAAAQLPAAVVAVTRDVVKAVATSVEAVYQKAVAAAGAVVRTVSTAASAAGDFLKAAAPTIAGIAVGAIVTGGCLAATGGVGSAACVVAGFAAGGAVSGAMSCPPGRSVAGCAARGGAVGAVTGAVTVATGGAGGFAMKLGADFAGGVVEGAAEGLINGEGISATDLLLDGAAGTIGLPSRRGGGGGKSPDVPSRSGGTDLPSGSACPIKRPSSFTAGERVLLADGSTKAIEDMEVGDRVVATDPDTGRTSAEVVTHTITRSGDKNLVDVTVTTPGRPGASGTTYTLTATDEHPFWDPVDREWTDAEDLRPGDKLQTPDGDQVTITATRAHHDTTRVYNLTVAKAHTYYVVSGANSAVLTHNCGGEAEGTRLYRGVSENHHAYGEALKGEAWPGDPMGGHMNGEWHAAGLTRDSFLTSWTTDRAVAERFGRPGVILHTTLERVAGRIQPGPDRLGESEVLLRGVVQALRVERIN